MTFLRIAAQEYRFQDWVTMPLGYDHQGFPKRPIVRDWPKLTMDDIWDLPWHEAIGIGIVLGPASRNLAVIDLDDPELAERAATIAHDYYFVRTARDRGHLYVEENIPSQSRVLRLQWAGKPVTVELKAGGTQVAAPPSPGYSVRNDKPVIQGRAVQAVWQDLATHLGIEALAATERVGYPPAWQPTVAVGDRNDAEFIEAIHLAEAGLPREEAVEFMRWRFQRNYGKDPEKDRQGDAAMLRTIRSAYERVAQKYLGLGAF